MKHLKQILEGLLAGQDATLNNGEKDAKAALGVPTVDDFILNSSGSAVYWECGDKLKKYNGYSWCPMRASGLQFSIYRTVAKKCVITIKFCEEDTKFASYYASQLKGWNTGKYSDKPVAYCKKVVISLIEHLAKNPKAFNAMLDYNMEIHKDIACKQSYDDGRYMPWKEFEELFKIKG